MNLIHSVSTLSDGFNEFAVYQKIEAISINKKQPEGCFQLSG